MKNPQHIAVIDIGKTNIKLALVDLASLSEIAVLTRPNTVLSGPPWPHFDTSGHWKFLQTALAEFHLIHRIDAISITTHGACAVLLEADGSLAAPVLDYEHNGPEDIAAAYDKIRPLFSQTGSPRLANGLNIGAQLHWLFTRDPDLHDRTAHILTYPQYWGYLLTGVAASDVTSVGCHTDLWLPREAKFSNLVETLGIANKIAPVRKSGDILGTILPEIAATTGLSPDTPVVCGLHDSNASLYPHLQLEQPPLSVVSTGTWVIVMTMNGKEVILDPARDTLINVNAFGNPVISARFMGGREFEIIKNGHTFDVSQNDVNRVLNDKIMLLPAVEPSTGPFQGRKMQWIGPEPAAGTGIRSVSLSYYLALMTATCLGLTGANGPTIVEGPFTQNSEYLAMLCAATERPVQISKSTTGTSIGAALLFGSSDNIKPAEAIPSPAKLELLRDYAKAWHSNLTQEQN
ncbi:carbohydrate kinase [Amylibacter ulvae]|uniref:Carbohydrate kinase n=1 Tax=Paramylibacter ulvae TaxID=1651968 RepID=A0ABQ3D707_9RHOB|nr:FGGY-family carbohydrate kinase [Amylibacter ulvae]GHA62202.1 carbohydrate kinase [Amylibacter ulvae]